MVKIKHIGILLLFILALACCKDDVPTDVEGDLTDIDYDPTLVNVATGNATFPMLEQPDDNLMTEAGVDLGRHLFYDSILSADFTMSCSSCHLPSGSFTDNLALSAGIDGIEGRRSSMSLLNVGFYNRGLFWDGRTTTLEEQALLPVEDPVELHNTWMEAVSRLQESDLYPEKFRKAFGIENTSEITKELAAKALAQFERTLVSATSSKFDRATVLFTDVFTPEEEAGFFMFFDYFQGQNPEFPDAQCFHCHDRPLMTSNGYENNGLDYDTTYYSFDDIGHGEVTGIIGDNGKFRTPTLRNIEFTAPYMHDGRFETLDEVMDHYISGGQYSLTKSAFLDSIHLDNSQKQALISFLKTLSDPEFIENPAFSSPF
jgi:cytochrome c peroxidase